MEVIHSETKLYLVFEYLDQDLKKYMDTMGPLRDPEVKVHSPLFVCQRCLSSSLLFDTLARQRSVVKLCFCWLFALAGV
jgi:hypothetical protein